MSEGFQTDLSGDAMFTFLLPLVMFPFVASPAVSNPMPQPNSSGNAQIPPQQVPQRTWMLLRLKCRV